MIFTKNKFLIPSKLKKFNEVFKQNNFKAYLVGGAVRDLFLNKKASDFDVATNATPQDVIKMFKFVVPTGIEHGTVTVHFMDEEIEVTTFRTESGYSDGRHPDSVNYAATIGEDLSRRDFTINAIALDLNDGKIVDPYKGRKDIKKKIIRTVGNPHERFMEDGLRPVRALRFAGKLGFCIEKKTYSEIFEENVQKKIASISVERFRDELLKLMTAPKPSVGLKLMEESGIFKIFMPELLPCRGCIQKDDRSYHVFDVMDHCIYACDGAPKEKPLLRLAALLHDAGKPASKTEKNENGFLIYHFYNHEVYSAELSQKLMTRLKFSNADIEYVSHLIRCHMFNYTPDWSNAAVRRFMVKIKIDNLDDLIDLRLADMYGKYNQDVRKHDSEACRLLIELSKRVRELNNESSVLSLKDLQINGDDLIKLGIKPGKQIGLILKDLFEEVLEAPEINNKEKLTELVKERKGLK